MRLQPLENSPWCRPQAPKRSELVAVVASMCIKGLRLVTMQLPEKFSPISIRRSSVAFIRYSSRVPETTVFGTIFQFALQYFGPTLGARSGLSDFRLLRKS